jgi:cyclophilin family peptidyl-prolyl cis-trans isomerase
MGSGRVRVFLNLIAWGRVHSTQLAVVGVALLRKTELQSAGSAPSLYAMLLRHKSIVAFCLCGLTADCRADFLAQFHTPAGDMDVQLFSQDKPVTVQNFVNYSRYGYYQNMFLHRCVPNFIVQGGGFAAANPTDPSAISTLYYVPSLGTITNEYSVGRTFSNVYGTIAMAKVGGDPNSATSQWFFNLANNGASLDNQNGGFTVFGRVLGGTNVLEQFNQLMKSGGGIVDLTTWLPNYTPFTDLPVMYTGNVLPKYTDLYYVDIQVLAAQISLDVTGARVVSWQSVNNKPNVVESSEVWPPAWQTLYTIQGTGAAMAYTDANTAVQRRYYRVRVDY